MSITARYVSKVDTTEALETNVPAAPSGSSIQHTGYGTVADLNATSTVPATKCAYFLKAMSAGAGTVDLTSLTGTNGATVTMLGLKVQVLKVKAPATNGAAVALTAGASNGIDLLGASWKVVLSPGQEFLFFGNDATPDVASGDRTIDLAGTGTDALQFSIVAG